MPPINHIDTPRSWQGALHEIFVAFVVILKELESLISVRPTGSWQLSVLEERERERVSLHKGVKCQL